MQRCAAEDPRTPGGGFSPVRALIRRIVDGVAEGQKYHLKVVFSDGSTHHSTRLGEPDVTIVFRSRRAEWRMALGGMFEFLESHFDGEVDILGEHGLRRLVNIGYRKPFGRFEHPLTHVKRRFLEWRQNNRNFARAKRNAAFHYGLPMEFFHLMLGDTYGYSEGFWEEDTRTLEEAQHNNFDRICRKLQLRPGGIGLISATFNMKSRPTNYCTIKHVFPGGYIPSLAQTLVFMEKHGLDVRAIENLSYHYHRTVDRWLANFEANWERIRAIDPARFNEKFRRALAVLPRGRGRDLRGRARDHQLLPHHVREGTFREQGPVAMRIRRLFTAALVFASLPVAAFAQSGCPGIHVKILNIRNSTGGVACAIFESAAGFPTEFLLSATKVMIMKVRDTQARCDFEDLPPGDYALAVIHDENMNGKLDTNWLGIPTEGYGFSNDARALLGAPSFSAAGFQYDGRTLDLTISLHY